MRLLGGIGAAVFLAALATPTAAVAGGAPVAATQAALDALGFYRGTVDGVRGPLTRRAIRVFQRRKGLAVDGIAGPRTRRALGWRGRPRLGKRAMTQGDRGRDVAALQFLLQREGHGPGRADGLFGPLTAGAVRHAQRSAGIAVDGIAGPVTIRSLRSGGRATPMSLVGAPTGPVRFLRPVAGRIGDGFGASRTGGRHHQGLDFPVRFGTRVGAAGRGTTIFAGYNRAGYGNLVVVQHRLGYTSWYAHLSTITTWVGETVSGGTRLGYVGSTGYSTGPHLHFEVRRYDTPIDPLPRLLSIVAARTEHRAARRSSGGDADCAAPRRPTRGGPWIAREPLCR